VITSHPFLVLGSGAMACLFAARLQASGQQVVMLDAWLEGLEAIRIHGIQILTENGSDTFSGIKTTSNYEDCRDIQYGLILSKSWQSNWAAEQLKFCLPANGIALSLQNGLGNLETLTKSLGEGRIAVGVTTLGATLLKPGLIRAHENGEVILSNDRRLESFTNIFQNAGFNVRIESDINAIQWGKLMVNAAVNPLSAITQTPNGQLLANPYTNSLMRLIIQEVADVAKNAGIHLPFDDPFLHVENIINATAGNYPSMYQDYIRGAISEIENIKDENG
jgi:2-dehydropantoate 2-reductase